jgi:hypothetical protein
MDNELYPGHRVLSFLTQTQAVVPLAYTEYKVASGWTILYPHSAMTCILYLTQNSMLQYRTQSAAFCLSQDFILSTDNYLFFY